LWRPFTQGGAMTMTMVEARHNLHRMLNEVIKGSILIGAQRTYNMLI